MQKKWVNNYSFYRVYSSLDDIIDQSIEVAKQFAKEKDPSTPIELVYMEKGGAVPGELVAHILRQMGYTVNTYQIGMKNNDINKEGAGVDLYKVFNDEQEERFVEGVFAGHNVLLVDEVGDSVASFKTAMDYIWGELKEQPIKYLEKKSKKDYQARLWTQATGAVLDKKPRFYSANSTLQDFIRFHARGFGLKEKINRFILTPKQALKLWTVYPWEIQAKEAAYFNEDLYRLTQSGQDGRADIKGIQEYVQTNEYVQERLRIKGILK